MPRQDSADPANPLLNRIVHRTSTLEHVRGRFISQKIDSHPSNISPSIREIMAGPSKNPFWELNNRDLELYFHLLIGHPSYPDSRRKTAREITEIFEKYDLAGEHFHPTQYDNSLQRLRRMGLFYGDGTPTKKAPRDFLDRFMKSYGRIRFDFKLLNSPVTRDWIRLGLIVINSIEQNPKARLFEGSLHDWELPMTADLGHDLLSTGRFEGILLPEEVQRLDEMIVSMKRDLIQNLKSLEPLRKSWRARQGMRVASKLSRFYRRRFGGPLPELKQGTFVRLSPLEGRQNPRKSEN